LNTAYVAPVMFPTGLGVGVPILPSALANMAPQVAGFIAGGEVDQLRTLFNANSIPANFHAEAARQLAKGYQIGSSLGYSFYALAARSPKVQKDAFSFSPLIFLDPNAVEKAASQLAPRSNIMQRAEEVMGSGMPPQQLEEEFHARFEADADRAMLEMLDSLGGLSPDNPKVRQAILKLPIKEQQMWREKIGSAEPVGDYDPDSMTKKDLQQILGTLDEHWGSWNTYSEQEQIDALGVYGTVAPHLERLLHERGLETLEWASGQVFKLGARSPYTSARDAAIDNLTKIVGTFARNESSVQFLQGLQLNIVGGVAEMPQELLPYIAQASQVVRSEIINLGGNPPV